MSDIPAPMPPNFDYPIATSAELHVVPENTRHFFYWLILTISVLAIIGNILAIRSIIERKTKFLQKLCILTLSLTDILSTILYATSILDMLSNQLITWDLGEFLCYFLPIGQVFATTASSLILVVIAMDRYQNCVNTFNKCRWNPKPITCVLLIGFILVVCVGISYPMRTIFNYNLIWVLMLPYTAEEAVYQLSPYCYGTKYKSKNYYIILDIVIFTPILITFAWFYIQIAILIWKHRKPVTSKLNSIKNKHSEDSTTNSTKTTNITTVEKAKDTIIKPKKPKNVQVQRKIRTFRIVLVLLVSFLLCRFPYWCYRTVRLISVRNDVTSWNIHFSLLALNLLNCVLNPLLYTFLNHTIAAVKMIREFLWKICCCCFSNDEFEEFEQDNPFTRDQIPPACGTVKARSNFGKMHFEERNEKVQKF